MKKDKISDFINYCSVSSNGVEPNIPRHYCIKPNKRTFFKKFWLLFFIIFLISTCLIALMIKNYSDWINFLGILISFLATCLVAIFIFYFSWKSMIYSENKNNPFIDLHYERGRFYNNFFRFDDKEIFKFHSSMVNYMHPESPDLYSNNYFDIRIKNLHTISLKTFRPCFILSMQSDNKGLIFKKSDRLHYIADQLSGMIENKEEKRILLSIPNSILDPGFETANLTISFLICFCVIDEFDKASYIVSSYEVENNSLSTKSVFITKKLFDKIYKIKDANNFHKMLIKIIKF